MMHAGNVQPHLTVQLLHFLESMSLVLMIPLYQWCVAVLIA